MPEKTTMRCPTCAANTLPAVVCPHCKQAKPIGTTFPICFVCDESVCPACISVVYGTDIYPTCHRCGRKEKESADGK